MDTCDLVPMPHLSRHIGLLGVKNKVVPLSMPCTEINKTMESNVRAH